MCTIGDIIRDLEAVVPKSLQESYDNCGLQIGDPLQKVTGILLAIDVTEKVIAEAIKNKANLIITHHPLLFKGLKRISTNSYIERCVQLAIRHDIAIYSAHTNLDNCYGGVNYFFATKLGLQNSRVIEPLPQQVYKVATYVPVANAHDIRKALLSANAGSAGHYQGCSFSVAGEGRFIPTQNASPYVGEANQWHTEPEVMISTMANGTQLPGVCQAIQAVHPYEEPVIDVHLIKQEDTQYGAGIIGDLQQPMSLKEFLNKLKEILPIQVICHSQPLTDQIQRVAYCGGSGAFLRTKAAQLGADIFMTGEAKYNDFYDAVDDVTLCTIGHYESEKLTEELIYNLLSRKKRNFDIRISQVCDNPISYIS